MKLRILGLVAGAIASSILFTSVAFAGGFEYPGDGVKGMGRGGAFYARADDPMATLYNPAALANIAGMQFLFSGHATLFNACIDRFGTYGNAAPGTGAPIPVTLGPTNEDISSIERPKVCNGQKFSPIPSLAFAWRVNKKIGVGFGVFFPNSVKNVRYGGSKGNIDQKTPGGQNLPSPLRYALIDDNIIVAYPTAGIGFRPTKWFQFGFAFTVGYAEVNFTNVIRVLSAGENPQADALTRVRNAKDWFVPRIMASVHFIPVDALDITVGVRYEDNIRAKGSIKTELTSPIPATLKGDITVTAPRPMWVDFGIRYADRINPRPDDPDEAKKRSGRVEDHFANERWDIELDAVYERNRVTDAITTSTRIPKPMELDPITSLPDVLTPTIVLPHGFKDQLSMRLGGDYNIIPGTVAVRAGLSYETEGFKKGHAVPEYIPLERYGFHVGTTVRVFKKIDLSAAYAYFYHRTRVVPLGEGKGVQVGTDINGDALIGNVINEGKYQVHIHVISAGLNVHLK